MSEDIPDTGAVFTFGQSRFADNEPSHFFIKNDPIVAISCGDEHSAVICQNGRVFVFGGNSWGQLGLGHKDEVSRPSCVKWLKPHRALFVACGRAHTVFVTDSHAVYTAGCNEEGQLGTGDTEPHTVPQYVEVDADDAQIRQVSAGSNHTAILTVSGRVFVCGSNSEGQLGLGEDARSCLKFTELKFMEKIAFVECGYYHTVFITTQGVVFITGDNEGQKLGIPNTESNIYVPVVLPLQTPIRDACCGANHTFLLSMDESKILAFGSNDAGQLGLPREVGGVTEPTEIDMDKMFDGNQLKLVACGAMHTAFVTDNGLLYTCGEARHNKLCLDEIDDNSNDPANQYTPKQVTAMDGYVVDNVACGGCHTLLTATKNSTDKQPDATETPQSIELPPLKLPMSTGRTEDGVNGNEDNSIDSLEANVSGSHIVSINDLDNVSTHDAPELKDEEPPSPIEKAEVMEIIDSMDTLAENVEDGMNDIKDAANEKMKAVEDGMKDIKNSANEKMEAVEEIIKKSVDVRKHKCEELIALNVPDKIVEIANSPPPKTPILQDLLHVPDLTQMTSDCDEQKSDAGSKSENETIPCGSDKSSPLAGKTKTQAVMPIVRSEDIMDSNEMMPDEEGVVVNKMDEKGRFARMFQSIRDKENSCMSKGKVIEETVEETVHKGISATEETVHKIEETVTTEIRNQTNSRTCNIL